MNPDDDIIILKREPGPVAGTSAVTVDAPGYKQAVFIVDNSIADTAEERVILANMINMRTAAADAARTDQI